VKTIVKESHNFELSCLKKKKKRKKEKHFDCLATFRFGTFKMLFTPVGMLFVMKMLEDELYVVKYKDLQVYCF